MEKLKEVSVVKQRGVRHRDREVGGEWIEGFLDLVNKVLGFIL